MNRIFNLLIILCCAFRVFSQVPNTDVWLFKLELNKQKQLMPVEPLNVSNREGYDNQPSFSPDKRSLYYVSMREDQQADIYCYDLKKKTTRMLTKSKESEYSPTFINGSGKIGSVVVEKDSTQRIHFFDPVLGADQGMIDLDSMGYYTFLNNDTLAYYKLTQPHSLRLHSQSTKEDVWLCNRPIRTFKAVNRHCLIYGIKDSSLVTFYKYDLLLRRAFVFCTFPSESEDIFWDEQWGLLKSEGTEILRFDEKKKEWVLLFDLSSFGIKKITRFCIDPQHKYLSAVNNL